MNQIINDYINHGWALIPIPANSKGPIKKKWNLKENAVTTVEQAMRHHGNIGLAHLYCKKATVALDIDDYTKAKVELSKYSIDLDKLFAEDNSVSIISGKPNRGKLLFHMPLGIKPPPSQKVSDNQGNTIFEIRCGSKNGLTVQDLIPPSVHPESGQTYAWAGNGHWSHLPAIPLNLLETWNRIAGNFNEANNNQSELSSISDINQQLIRDLKHALGFINSDDRDLWVKLGLALKGLEDDGYDLWIQWSKKSSKFDQSDADRVWESFQPSEISYKSIFNEASKFGWTTQNLSQKSQKTCPTGITAEALSAKVFEPLSWVIQDILPEGCYLLSARPKVGKSWLALQTCLGVAYGTPVLGKMVTTGKAIYLALEDNQRRLKDRLQLLRPEGFATSNLILFTAWAPLDQNGINDLKNLIETENPKLIVIDTLAKVRPSMGRNASAYESDYKALAPLTELANIHRCCILVVTHNRKGKSDTDAIEQVSGTLGLTGAVDGALVIDGIRNDKHYKLSLIGRDIPNDDELAISRSKNGTWEMLGQATQVFISEERRQITELLKLHPNGLKPKQIAEILCKKQPTVRKLLISMTVDQQVNNLAGVYTHSSNDSSEGNSGNSGN
jgi:predicted ATP-dependent serine protease